MADFRPGSSIQITKRDDRSLYMFFAQHLIRLFRTQLIKQGPSFPPGSPSLDVHKSAKKHCEVQERKVDDIYIYDLTAKKPAPDRESPKTRQRKRIYYFAGGGWEAPCSPEHWMLCTELARRIPNTTLSIVSYPLAPNSPAPVSFPQLMRLYHTLLEQSEQADETVILGGDSSGGNIILCLALAVLQENPQARCPTALMAVSPSADLRRCNPDIQIVKKNDPILQVPFIEKSARGWRGDWPAEDPRVSPIFGDASLLARRGVQVHGVVGGYDILGPDAVIMREKCNDAGVVGEWLEWDKQIHCFPLMWAYKLPEGVAAKNWMVDVLCRC
ncbi:hypothetical protein LTR08_007274 [Meristemomyces frigidus]|nr:hypothetical protein LTR08_007274 [Meristemomyces frigidus]